MKYLLVEDESGMSKFIVQGITEVGHVIDCAADGEVGLSFALSYEYDAIILDLMLPKMDGLQLLAEYRLQGGKSPVLLLTARGEVEDRVNGLDAGADDYLAKPFAFQELMARIRALQRRPPLQNGANLAIGDLEMALASHQVRRGSKLIDLSVREFSLLEMFLRHPNQVLSRTQIAQNVWNFDFYSDTNVVDVYVGYLRRKLDDGFDTSLIQTIRGIGYKLGLEE
ncbi:MAG: DNA-binding response regulator [Chloroflexi bacterium]|nr:response regulator transcription factor [Chloroflexota bacterium]MQC27069.1 DNA-binding response regulator [Chloroflexota bacterium]